MKAEDASDQEALFAGFVFGPRGFLDGIQHSIFIRCSSYWFYDVGEAAESALGSAEFIRRFISKGTNDVSGM